MPKLKSKKSILFIVVILISLLLSAVIYSASRLDSNKIEETIDSEVPLSAPISYTQSEEITEVEPEEAAQVEGVSTIAQNQVPIPPQIKFNKPELPSGVDLPILPAPTNSQPVPAEVIQEDRCSNPDNTWVDFTIGSTVEPKQFGGEGTQYIFQQSTRVDIVSYLSYSCIDHSEFVEMWYDITNDRVQCYCGKIMLSNLLPGNYEMYYLLGVRDVVFYDFINLTIEEKPKPPVNNAPVAKILTPHGHYDKIKVQGNSYTFDLYGEMRDVEDGLITSGSSLKWYAEINHGELEYLFDGSGQYTVSVPNCTSVEVIIGLHVYDSTGLRRDDAFMVKLTNENCVVVE